LENSTSSTYIDPPAQRVPKDFFYPFYIRSGAKVISIGIIGCLAGLLALT